MYAIAESSEQIARRCSSRRPVQNGFHVGCDVNRK
jgi:hypothetical protein